ncbi:uncharacterized protein MELLADRAFT_65949 [Melampsora larici-populina 98AG31]|uniref:Uncharacterized protein n=1 Tax=Melampsora larici-populina (strain 98AG31 / pathotype 3-4-7) TaxID=747676 RepID=F4RXB9_MELLP|nr:uncharacterized protein MELLADRAFT_65949 [Melampsora larici-populina 98AG31]EGG03013.1 hypothetical protein MELLADRAFT_65949 [Melampsora larici-populina 98AG31]
MSKSYLEAFRESKGADSRSRALLEALTHALDTNNGAEARRLVADFNDSYGSLVAMDYDGYIPPDPKESANSQPNLQAQESQKSATQDLAQQKPMSSRLMDSSQLLASISGSLLLTAKNLNRLVLGQAEILLLR